MMHYSIQSPVFQVFELTTRKLTGRFGRHDKQNPTFCLNCHSPTSSYASETYELKRDEPFINKLSALSKNGIHCTMCHSVRGPENDDNFAKGALGDSIGNATHSFFPNAQLVGPTTTEPLPEKNSYHSEGFWPEKDHSRYLRSSQFCGACHDVRIPNTNDTITGKPFQRIENLFTEWSEGPYNTAKNPQGKPVSCVDCHMSLYGMPDPKTGKPTPPGVFPQTEVALGAKVQRPHALHAFTAVSTSLIDPKDSAFPSDEGRTGKDRFGFPKGQQERRQQMLEQAVTLSWGTVPETITGVVSYLPLKIQLMNSGAGHRVPSGFSQEREVWLHLKIVDGNGRVVYESGQLEDRPHPETGEISPDGRTDDEDLQNKGLDLQASTLEPKNLLVGPDFNFRPFAQVGLPTFQNAFLRKHGPRGYERVHFFTLANHIDNERSLPMLKPIILSYDVPIQRWLKNKPGYCGPVSLKARLQYRTLPPFLLRALSQREPELLNESMIDRNSVVTMAQIQKQIRVCGAEADSKYLQPTVTEKTYSFSKGESRWIAHTQYETLSTAFEKCNRAGCGLATVSDYDSLGFADYVPTPGDNKDELMVERWAAEASPTTYLFSIGTNRAAKVDGKLAQSLKLPFFCKCKTFNQPTEERQ